MRKHTLTVLMVGILAAVIPAWADVPSHPDVVTPQPEEEAQQPASFDGAWAGTIHFDKEAVLVETSTPAGGQDMRIEVHGPVVRVFAKNLPTDQKMTEFMPGSFYISPVMANAVVLGTHFSQPWTETWVFVLTHKDDDTLLVNFTRVVNNQGFPLSDPSSKFSTRGVGDFKRVDR